MNIIIQLILAFLMLYHALPKIFFSKNNLKIRGGKQMEYVDDLSQNNLKLIGKEEEASRENSGPSYLERIVLGKPERLWV